MVAGTEFLARMLMRYDFVTKGVTKNNNIIQQTEMKQNENKTKRKQKQKSNIVNQTIRLEIIWWNSNGKAKNKK